MAFALGSRTIGKIGVIGSGQIGPDVALHFAGALAQHDVRVLVVDIAPAALEQGRARVQKKIAKGTQAGAISESTAAAMSENLGFTSDYDALGGADLVVEAASEDREIKGRIVATLEGVLDTSAVITSNSSHMRPEVIFAQAKDPGRGLVTHYFFPADRSKIVEVVPGEKTRAEVTEWVLDFYGALGKQPFRVGSRYGYAVDPIFEGIFAASALAVEAGWGSVKQMDVIAKDAIGLGVGPFTAMNLTGGNPITQHGLNEMHDALNSWFRSPRLLDDQMTKGDPWKIAGRGENVDLESAQAEQATLALQGAYFGLVGGILDAGITNVRDLDTMVAKALVVRAPFAWMNELGPREALARVESYALIETSFPVPECLREQARTGEPWAL